MAFGASPLGAGPFEVLIEVPSSPERHYITEMQKSTKSHRGRDRDSVKRDRGKLGRKEKMQGSTKEMDGRGD